MAGKRINKTAPLSAAEKQKRHREKKAEEKRSADDVFLSKMRETFISDINKLSLDELMALMRKAYSKKSSIPDRVTLKELSEMTGVSVYELKKLEAQGVIEPIKENGLEGADLSIIGLTEDEFMRFVKYLDTPLTLKELSAKAEIPLYKLERMDKMGFFRPA